MQGQGQKYGQKHETKELVQFHNHLQALTMIGSKVKQGLVNAHGHLIYMNREQYMIHDKHSYMRFTDILHPPL